MTSVSRVVAGRDGDRIRNRIDAPAHDMSLTSSSPLSSGRKSELSAWAFPRREGQDEAAFRHGLRHCLVSARSDEIARSKTRTCVPCELVLTSLFAGSTTAYFGDSTEDGRPGTRGRPNLAQGLAGTAAAKIRECSRKKLERLRLLRVSGQCWQPR